jgi:aldose 1-epimerase
VGRHLSTRSPSGEQIEIAHGDQRAVVVEVGGGLRTYTAGGRAILDGYGESELCGGARGQPLMPWPNRIRDGRYEWEGRPLQLDITEPERNNAIHGLTRWRSWRIAERDQARVVLEDVLYPTPGYPFTLDLQIVYELLDHGLVVTTRAHNIGVEAAPYGVGFHPYLQRPDASLIDAAILTLPAAVELVADKRSIPKTRAGVGAGARDFRAPRAIGELVIDTCFTDLSRDADGLARFVLAEPDGSARTAVWLDDAYPYVMVYTGDTLPPAERRRGIAIEPMTCAPNAFQTGEGLVRLEPGATHQASWGISPA